MQRENAAAQGQMLASFTTSGHANERVNAGKIPLSNWPAPGTGIAGVGTGGEGGKWCGRDSKRGPRSKPRAR